MGIPVYEGFISTECLFMTLNFPLMFRQGTAGSIADKEVDLRLSDVGEIQVKSPMVFQGYFEQPEITASSFTEDGYFKTGDKGAWREYPTAKGTHFLEITGRVKDMIILNQCENVWPETLEGVFKRCPAILDCIIPMSCEAPGRKYLIMLVCLMDDHRNAVDADIKEQMAQQGS